MISPESTVFETPSLKATLREVPWDSAVFGFPVALIEDVRGMRGELAESDFQGIREWLDANAVRLVTCRLPHDQLTVSFFLEQLGFRFVEMVLHPFIERLGEQRLDDQGLRVSTAVSADLEALVAIAETAFGCERYHVDPRIDRDKANMRYGNWVRGCLRHPSQRLLKVTEGEQIVALFVTETQQPGRAYWHLTAVAPPFQGNGIGRRAWKAMLRYHQEQKIDVVATTISARNNRVLNLYSHLGFRFSPPEMTFHWMRD